MRADLHVQCIACAHEFVGVTAWVCAWILTALLPVTAPLTSRHSSRVIFFHNCFLNFPARVGSPTHEETTSSGLKIFQRGRDFRIPTPLWKPEPLLGPSHLPDSTPFFTHHVTLHSSGTAGFSKSGIMSSIFQAPESGF